MGNVPFARYIRLRRFAAGESRSFWSQSCAVRSACRLRVDSLVSEALRDINRTIVPVKHNPLRDGHNALLCLIQSRQLGLN